MRSPVAGLVVVRGFLNEESQSELVRFIDSEIWSTELKRRVQHWGFRYDYAARSTPASMERLPFPEWADELVRRMTFSRITMQDFDQVIVNEYLPGQGIAPHIDSVSLFGNEIVSISLGSPCVIEFSRARTAETFHQLLEPGDLLLMRDESRYQWSHRIRPRKVDSWEGRIIRRGRRLSVTFRKVLDKARKAEQRGGN